MRGRENRGRNWHLWTNSCTWKCWNNAGLWNSCRNGKPLQMVSQSRIPWSQEIRRYSTDIPVISVRYSSDFFGDILWYQCDISVLFQCHSNYVPSDIPGLSERSRAICWKPAGYDFSEMEKFVKFVDWSTPVWQTWILCFLVVFSVVPRTGCAAAMAWIARTSCIHSVNFNGCFQSTCSPNTEIV